MAPKTTNLSIEDIASEVGVSASLVSKVLSGRLGTTRVSAKTLRAIHERGSGYRKNSSAAALATGRQNVVTAFIHRVGVPGSGVAEGLVEGIADALAQHEQRLTLFFYSSERQFRGQSVAVHSGMTDGVIVGGLPHRELLGDLKEIEARGVPVVTMHEEQFDPAFANVGSDQVVVGQLATRHLIERGCRRIARICSNVKRNAGYMQALREAGLPQAPRLRYVAADYGFASGEAAVHHFAAAGVEYDGIVASSDPQAIGAMNALVRMGRRVPEDVKLIGVDDSPYCEASIVPLSSVAQMERERGRRAVSLLMDLIEKRPVKSAWIDPILRVRASTA